MAEVAKAEGWAAAALELEVSSEARKHLKVRILFLKPVPGVGDAVAVEW